MNKEDCLFCNIATKRSPSKIVYEDDNIIAVLDIDPVAEGHTLVMPKNHADNILDIEEETLKHIVLASQKISKKMFETLAIDGINIVQNNKEAAGQVISHYHMHIIPRTKDDGFKILNIQASIDKDYFSMLDETLNKIKL